MIADDKVNAITELSLLAVDDYFQQHFESLENRPEFTSAEYLRDQIEYAVKYLRATTRKVPFRCIADYFGKSISAIRKYETKYNQITETKNGTLLNDSQFADLVNYVNRQYNMKMPCRYIDVINYCFEKFNVDIKLNILLAMIERSDMLKTVVGKPIESTSMLASTEEINEYFVRTNHEIKDIPAAFIANADETGVVPLKDAKDVSLIVRQLMFDL
ncbi:hypothetical protein TRFO_14677 [Tritrichomonas foetus]|uniref:Uncharacterized protein n=1 Tax=Tritrichomonas foetus TaxID=1144522 RepID=A0A1J4KUE4_9EUKA|nr:hypothetical protein TRFO_14677 [Tritrichomonas foetus]|eukprot:OHT14891.1 hypothetical protein TRFO_14677 [Tritrichomonas foetus]